jgi:hypothetical protein
LALRLGKRAKLRDCRKVAGRQNRLSRDALIVQARQQISKHHLDLP